MGAEWWACGAIRESRWTSRATLTELNIENRNARTARPATLARRWSSPDRARGAPPSRRLVRRRDAGAPTAMRAIIRTVRAAVIIFLLAPVAFAQSPVDLQGY